ncbi:putative membrane protein [Wickerhamomyces ciferrii]|uniref:Membrane protein n=1 Tax=Wickerhamomyces ciferrii (strain ATCC 14091 / BCRC 22168 / CBS 111 / JCM 3599 / NBRC 0793 / NRRL Y-1031 F-60-10) TaxID=1206466 RepID=K0KXC7_WICCF|nr:uncharacterized protein BN7_5314 [Wickerhamomyces ciferrii]CCH45728.1 putative membrane protein [Wickerhamomyces ciferrii]
MSNQQYLESTAQDSKASNEVNPDLETFYQKYGDLEIKYIEPPQHSPWFTKPYALNYFHNDTLYRTKNERTSSKLELFLDLVITGILSNLTSNFISKGGSGYELIKFLGLFITVFVIWSDLKDFMNYYFNDDLLQRGFVIWLLVLLITFDNNCEFIDLGDDDENTLWICVGCYSMARLSLSAMLLFYSFFIHEHKIQMRLYGISLIITSLSWFWIFQIHNDSYKWIFAGFMLVIEQVIFCFSVLPWTKRKLGLEYSTALNIEHEDERFSGFVIIGIGELLYNIVSGSPLQKGLNERLTKGLSILIMGYLIMGIYNHKDGCLRATHALRRSAITAILYIYLHAPLVASLLIIGDSGIELIQYHKVITEENFNILKCFQVGLGMVLILLTGLASLDKSRDGEDSQEFSKFGRLSMRIPVAIVIIGLTWSFKMFSIGTIIWIDTGLLFICYFYEFIVMNPLNFNIRINLGLTNVQDV